MSPLARIVNLAISAIVTWLVYPREIALVQVSSILQKILQLSPVYELLLEGVILLANFVLFFLLLSVIFEVFESKD